MFFLLCFKYCDNCGLFVYIHLQGKVVFFSLPYFWPVLPCILKWIFSTGKKKSAKFVNVDVDICTVNEHELRDVFTDRKNYASIWVLFKRCPVM